MSKTLSPILLALSLLSIVSCTAPSQLLWYETCGDPICMDNGYRPKPGIPVCTSAQVNRQACATSGEMCDPVNSCNSLLLCTDSNPTQTPGGCPISVRNAKTDIQYLSQDEYLAYLERISQMKLAHYRYKWDRTDERPRLGFIIDDVSEYDLPAVAKNGKSVDLYGYVSMAVAAIKMQSQQIAQLQKELEALKADPPVDRDFCRLQAPKS